MKNVVVGLDGSRESGIALIWAAGAIAPGGRLHAVHVVSPVGELAVDAVLGDSVAGLERRRHELEHRWLAPVGAADVELSPAIVEGSVARSLVTHAQLVDADAIVVGHHPHSRLGPQVVGHVTAALIRDADRPVVVVPDEWAGGDDDAPVVVGVGVAEATRAAIGWGLEEAAGRGCGLSLVHALGHRSIFRPDGLLDLLAFHLDPSVLSQWVEEDLAAVAERIREESGRDVDISWSVRPGVIGPRLVQAGHGARMLVIGRGRRPFVGSRVLAPYLRHALTHATCPVAVIPPGTAPAR